MSSRPRTARTVAVVTLLMAAALGGCADDEAPAPAASDCAFPDTGQDPARPVQAPPARPDLPESMTATLQLAQGPVTIALATEEAPCTVGNFVSLATQGYYDGTMCHRVSRELSLVQCGDPTAMGQGGPGYSVPDELTGGETYGPGTVAMANTGLPNSGGAQFFLVHDDNDLPPKYTVLGTMDEESVEVLRGIAATGTSAISGDGPPREPVVLESVTID